MKERQEVRREESEEQQGEDLGQRKDGDEEEQQ